MPVSKSKRKHKRKKVEHVKARIYVDQISKEELADLIKRYPSHDWSVQNTKFRGHPRNEQYYIHPTKTVERKIERLGINPVGE